MPRARILKPGFFRNDQLADCGPWARLCFAGLWTLADREGRMEDRPKRIKGDLFAYDSVEVDELLRELETHGFIIRYAVDGIGLIQIVNFLKHQNPHHREPGSDLPPPTSPGPNGHGMAPKPEALPSSQPIQASARPEALPSSNGAIALGGPRAGPWLDGHASAMHDDKAAAEPEPAEEKPEPAGRYTVYGNRYYCSSGAGATSVEVACPRPSVEAPQQPPVLSLVGGEKPALPPCPHREVLALWAEVLPHMPQHLPDHWHGKRADHLRARWRETAKAKGWRTAEDGLAYLRKLFGYVGESAFLTGRKHAHNRDPFHVELAWLVERENWAKVHEGKYHAEQGVA